MKKNNKYKPGDPTRQCWACKKTKPVEEFTKNKNGVDGYATLCLECKRTRSTNWRSRQPGYYRDRDLRRYYGIGIEDFDAILELQGGGCRICGKTPEEDTRTFHVDHSHATGRIRGILCHGCNTGIGLFKENVAFLQEAISYIERDQAWPTN
jgi:hypothetical protein